MMKLSIRSGKNQARCLLCPHHCILFVGENGKCRTRSNQDGQILPNAYGAISSITTGPIGKKPFGNFLQGTKTLSIGSWGCNLHCEFCENSSISQAGPPEDRFYSPEDIIALVKYHQCESVCMTYNEPILAFEYLMDLGKVCHGNDLKLIIKTNAYIDLEPWEEICKVVDAVNIDMKGIYSFFKKMTGCIYNGIYSHILCATFEEVHVEISIPVYAGIDMAGSLYHFCEEMKRYRLNIPCHLLKMIPAYKMIDTKETGDWEIIVAKEILDEYFTHVYV